MESFKNKEIDFNLAIVKEEEVDATIAKMNSNVAEINENISMSLVQIKTEPNWTTDCDTALATVHLMHQEADSFIKEEIDSNADVSNNNNVTVHLLIPETIMSEKTGVEIQANNEENSNERNSSVDSNLQPTQLEMTETREDSIHSNVSSDVIHENTSEQSDSNGSAKRQCRKRKPPSKFCDWESLSSESSNESETVKKRKKKSSNETVKKRKKGSSNAAEVSPSDVGDPGSSTPHSTTLGDLILAKQSEKKAKTKEILNKKREMIVCPFCDRKMAKAYFPQHARVHTDEKPFKCPKCPYTSHFKGPLNNHMGSHHPTQGYVIPK